MTDDPPTSFSGHALRALERLSELAERDARTASIFSTWGALVGSLQRFGFTLYAVIQHLIAVSDDEELELIPTDLANEIRADLAEIAAAFPGVDELIFGTDAIDDLIDAAVANDVVRDGFGHAGRALGVHFDRAVAKLVEMAFAPDSFDMTHEQVAGYLSRLERVLDRVLDYWMEKSASV